jgi:membrane-bound metal-dependent hydrolase YbcI (DUF457 family)
MQKKTHLAFGLMLASIFFFLGMPFQYTFSIGFVAFLPDIDWLVDKLWLKEDSFAKRIWFRIFKRRSIHRTFLHNVWIMIILGFIFGYFSKWDILTIFGVFIGYFSHLLMDSLTVSGVYWLWPYGDERIFSKRKFYKNGNFVTGSLKEKTWFGLFVILGGVLFGFGFYRIQQITTQDIYHLIITIAIIIIFGIALMMKLVKTLSVVTSRMFKSRSLK